MGLKASEFWYRLPEYQGLEYPGWSEGWLSGFKNRYNFRRYRKVGKASSVEITEDIITQIKRIQVIKAEYLASNTYNLDKTGFLWKRLPNIGLTTTSTGKRVNKT